MVPRIHLDYKYSCLKYSSNYSNYSKVTRDQFELNTFVLKFIFIDFTTVPG